MTADANAAAVRAAFRALDAALGRQDFVVLEALCTEDFTFIGSGAGEEASGLAALRETFEGLAAQAEGLAFRLEWEDIAVQLVTDDVALLLAAGTATTSGPSGTSTACYRLSGVLVRRGTDWLWRLYHGSEGVAW